MKRIAPALYLLFILTTLCPATGSADLLTSSPAQKANGSDLAAGADAARTDDSIWMISTRHLGCPCGNKQSEPNFRFLRYDGEGSWQKTDWSEWSAAEQPGTTTVIYVHGNRVESGEAYGRGLAAYRALTRNAVGGPPIRFVVWSWPSSKTPGPRPKRDARVKAARTVGESFYLAQFLARLHPETQLSLLGYSFGARIISGALHLSEGGSLGCYRLTEGNVRPAHSVRVAFLAAAMNNDWWLPGHYHSRALSSVDQLLSLYNTCDPVLRFYPRLERRSRAQALGYTGAYWLAGLGEDRSRVEQVNVCCKIGKTHDEYRYFASDSLMGRVSETLLAF